MSRNYLSPKQIFRFPILNFCIVIALQKLTISTGDDMIIGGKARDVAWRQEEP